MNIKTDGTGLWSRTKRSVKVNRVELVCSVGFGADGVWSSKEIQAHFDTKTWDTGRLGLIYTDKGFLTGLRNTLRRHGLGIRAASAIQYTEQGMQGDDYVSLEISHEAPWATRSEIVEFFTRDRD